ncbi:peroxidase-like protein 3 [Patella vulgata]|uniref:peroxidase-like protein 3 n=1 Tax=Patella vulgata TaxID=6465 RepID=UPI0024A83C1D|nr:peroxidase-like protein 3 [Patella vulgata]
MSDYIYKSGACFPIIIPENDVHFKTNCMKFTRSRPFDDTSKPREQFNAITSFIDGSMVYGSSEDEMNALRTGTDGLMSTSAGNLLPEDDNVDACRKKQDEDFCFLAGDARVNVFPGLAALHTVFVRFHNRLASKMAFIAKIAGYFFKRLPLVWNDERIFQATRKIVSAVIQKINNDEFLPILLGPKNIEKYQIWAPYKYDKYRNPMIINAFATAAFRYGHSQIPDTMKIAGEEVPIHKLYFKTNSVIHHFSDLVKTIVGNQSEKSDVHFSQEVANKLFLLNNHSLDLFSLNIQRGRDHGLGSFNDYRRECNLQPATSFSSDIFGSCSQSLKDVYASVDDIDLFVGGMCEPPEEDAILGPTFACIVGRQFRNLKHGDRFWYETQNIYAGLGNGMVNFVKEITMSRILCDHGDISEIQPFSFLAADSKKNSVRPCTEIPNYGIRALVGLMTGK